MRMTSPFGNCGKSDLVRLKGFHGRCTRCMAKSLEPHTLSPEGNDYRSHDQVIASIGLPKLGHYLHSTQLKYLAHVVRLPAHSSECLALLGWVNAVSSAKSRRSMGYLS